MFGNAIIFLLTAHTMLAMTPTRQFAPTVNPLCQNLGSVCHNRAHSMGLQVGTQKDVLYDCTYTKLSSHQLHSYRLVAVNCTEEYLCTCGLDVSRGQVQALDDYYNEYLTICRQGNFPLATML
ncbi:hypothetical protein PoB_002517800 [Plakobranchus ocellatus]|uniref:Uncharacterized protein n=1 Tax=Plakobranchus ocellatus TaxID=259542 RepID=A0AAV3ZUX2_9GAST|nr:hypothetical protein PoB_002517800 [Plakobranchus ocellatus]